MIAASGYGEHVDGFTAGESAARMLQARLPQPDVLLCFASVHADQPEVLRGIRSVLGETPLLGGSSGATITDAGWRKRAVALLGLSSDRLDIAVGLGRDCHLDARAAALHAADEIRRQLPAAPKILLVFPQSVIGCDHPAFLAALHEAFPGTFIAGGASAMDGLLDPSHPLFLKSFQYWQDAVLEHTTPILALGWAEGKAHDAFAWGHGFLPIGLEARVTRCEGGTVHTIDDLPAAEFFRSYMGESFDFRIDAAMATLGMVERLGEKTMTRVNPTLNLVSERSIQYIMPMVAGQEVQLLRTTRTELLGAAHSVAQQLRDRLEGRDPSVIFMFSCGGRQALLGDSCREELAAVQGVFGPDVPIIGLQAGGEFSPLATGRHQTDGPPTMFGQWHNYSLSLYALSAE